MSTHATSSIFSHRRHRGQGVPVVRALVADKKCSVKVLTRDATSQALLALGNVSILELWARIEPLLPVVSRRADHPGRKRLDDCKVLSGILFVLHTGIPWEFLPQELGFGSGMTCWRRLRDWNDAGVWQRLHESLLAELHAVGALDWSRAVIDGFHVRAVKGKFSVARRVWMPHRLGGYVAVAEQIVFAAGRSCSVAAEVEPVTLRGLPRPSRMAPAASAVGNCPAQAVLRLVGRLDAVAAIPHGVIQAVHLVGVRDAVPREADRTAPHIVDTDPVSCGKISAISRFKHGRRRRGDGRDEADVVAG